MSVKLGVVMDPIEAINYKKDSTLAMLVAAQQRGWSLHYMEINDLFWRDDTPWAQMRDLSVAQDPNAWYQLGAAGQQPLHELDVVLMRKDPPVDMEYWYATYLLEQAEARGTLVVNRAQSLRDANEKLFAAWFPQCMPPNLVSATPALIRKFLEQQRDIVVKPLDAMGGTSVFRLREGDPNISVVLETLTEYGRRHVMAQRFLPEISQGDKRILLIDGTPVPYALARVPAPGELRGNLAAGGSGVGVELTERDRWLCAQVAPTLREKGLLFVGLDVIGDWLTEINVTSPTCIRELDALYGLDIAGDLMGCIAARLAQQAQPGDA
ncbi:MAG: glutathione synthetase [Gammaproteobacteria bacterium SG8_47]|nr:MAG: glutathione synthetase [Gammaproteobacteria bacterium SG8_47]